MKLCSKLGIILFVLQILDALLTYIGVINFGIEAEGNPIVKRAIITFGAEFGLIFVKLLSLIPIYILVKTRSNNILMFLIGLYFGVVLIWAIALYKTLL